MDTATVLTNLVCNQACTFCTFRRAADDPQWVRPSRVLADVRDAAGQGVRTLVLTGGEPTMNRHLDAYVRAAKTAGIPAIVLETNAMLLGYEGRAQALRDAGVTTVRVALNGVGEDSDRLTRTPSGFEHTLAGMRECAAAGLDVEVSLALTAQNLEAAAALPGLVAGLELGVRSVVLRVVAEGPAEVIATFAQYAAAVSSLVLACREQGLTCRFDSRHQIPLCFFSQRRALSELFSVGPPVHGHGFRAIDGCDRCAAGSLCSGVPGEYLDLHGAAGAVPVPESESRFVRGLGSDRRKLVERELVTDAWYREVDGTSGLERVLRVVFHCNQNCAFCFVNRDLPSVARERIAAEIDRAVDDGVTLLSLSGGEPTLNPDLLDHVARAAGRGMRIQLQTNAIRSAKPGYAAALKAAGLDEAFVSLHGSAPGVSDAVTSAPGTFVRTVAGITSLLDAGINVRLNFVVTGKNHADLPAVVAMILDRWGTAPELNLSYAHASTDLVPVNTDVVPRFGDVRGSLVEALRKAKDGELRVRGFDGMCGLPLCFLESDWLDLDAMPIVPAPNPPPSFVKPQACSACEASDRCVGVRETYAELHGLDEVVPL